MAGGEGEERKRERGGKDGAEWIDIEMAGEWERGREERKEEGASEGEMMDDG